MVIHVTWRDPTDSRVKATGVGQGSRAAVEQVRGGGDPHSYSDSACKEEVTNPREIDKVGLTGLGD